MNMNKERNLSIAEFFSVLQKEYLIAEFRKKIYFKKSDKIYYQRVMDGKKEKINNIAQRNHLNSIFSDSKLYDECKKELFDSVGTPLFPFSKKDWESYYSINNEFSYKGEIWTLQQIIDEKSFVIFSEKYNKTEIVSNKDICRIL